MKIDFYIYSSFLFICCVSSSIHLSLTICLTFPCLHSNANFSSLKTRHSYSSWCVQIKFAGRGIASGLSGMLYFIGSWAVSRRPQWIYCAHIFILLPLETYIMDCWPFLNVRLFPFRPITHVSQASRVETLWVVFAGSSNRCLSQWLLNVYYSFFWRGLLKEITNS